MTIDFTKATSKFNDAYASRDTFNSVKNFKASQERVKELQTNIYAKALEIGKHLFDSHAELTAHVEDTQDAANAALVGLATIGTTGVDVDHN